MCWAAQSQSPGRRKSLLQGLVLTCLCRANATPGAPPGLPKGSHEARPCESRELSTLNLPQIEPQRPQPSAHL